MAQFGDSFASDMGHDPVHFDLPPPGERRAENRQPMNLQGVCESNDPPQRLPCTIVEMSGSGAKLEFVSTDQIPAAFNVYVAALNVVLECQVIWREQTSLGVEHVTRSVS